MEAVGGENPRQTARDNGMAMGAASIPLIVFTPRRILCGSTVAQKMAVLIPNRTLKMIFQFCCRRLAMTAWSPIPGCLGPTMSWPIVYLTAMMGGHRSEE